MGRAPLTDDYLCNLGDEIDEGGPMSPSNARRRIIIPSNAPSLLTLPPSLISLLSPFLKYGDAVWGYLSSHPHMLVLLI